MCNHAYDVSSLMLLTNVWLKLKNLQSGFGTVVTQVIESKICSCFEFCTKRISDDNFAAIRKPHSSVPFDTMKIFLLFFMSFVTFLRLISCAIFRDYQKWPQLCEDPFEFCYGEKDNVAASNITERCLSELKTVGKITYNTECRVLIEHRSA